MFDYSTSASFAVLPVSTFELVDVTGHEMSFNLGSSDHNSDILSESIVKNILSESIVKNILSESIVKNILSESIVKNILSESIVTNILSES